MPREARELIQRGLDLYAHGQLREAVQAWENAVRLVPHDRQAGRLLAFARRRLLERDARPTTRVRHDTLESPIPGYLASLTAVEAGESGGEVHLEIPEDGEWAQVDTRRVVAGMDELAAYDPGDERDASDTWRELPIQDEKLAASARGLVEECQNALRESRGDAAAMSAEMALQLCEQARTTAIHDIIDPARSMFERAFCACIGDMKNSPIRAIPSEELAAHGFDHRAAFLMSRLDGAINVADLLEMAGMPRFDALRLIAAMKRAQAVDMVPPMG
ncbi:MAG TPA: hypothetical protein VF518_00145 [Polyangia bacterium]